MPYQNFLSLRKIYYSRVIWIDPNIDNEENSKYKESMDKEFKKIGYCWSKDID